MGKIVMNKIVLSAADLGCTGHALNGLFPCLLSPVISGGYFLGSLHLAVHLNAL